MGLEAPDLSPSFSTSGLLGIKRSPAGGFGAPGLFPGLLVDQGCLLTCPGGEFQNLAEAPLQLQVLLPSTPCVPSSGPMPSPFLLSCRCQVIPADGVWPSIPAATCLRRAACRHLDGRIARAARTARCPGPSRTPCTVREAAGHGLKGAQHRDLSVRDIRQLPLPLAEEKSALQLPSLFLEFLLLFAR